MIANSRKTKDYWHQIKVMTNKLNRFAANGIIPETEINSVIVHLEQLKGEGGLKNANS